MRSSNFVFKGCDPYRYCFSKDPVSVDTYFGISLGDLWGRYYGICIYRDRILKRFYLRDRILKALLVFCFVVFNFLQPTKYSQIQKIKQVGSSNVISIHGNLEHPSSSLTSPCAVYIVAPLLLKKCIKLKTYCKTL